MKCQKCDTSVKNEWGFCPKCGCEVSPKEKPEVVTALSAARSAYSTGVRAQVFEVIVRQAMAGAPWRQICAGPMQVNNISPDDVEAEVNRRTSALKASGATVSQASPTPVKTPGELDEINFRPTSKTLISFYDSIMDISKEDLHGSKKALLKQRRVLENLADLVSIVEKLERDEMKG